MPRPRSKDSQGQPGSAKKTQKQKPKGKKIKRSKLVKVRQEALQKKADNKREGSASSVASVGSASSVVPIPPSSVHRASMGTISSLIQWQSSDIVETPVGTKEEMKHSGEVKQKETAINFGITCTPKPETAARELPGGSKQRSVRSKQPASTADIAPDTPQNAQFHCEEEKATLTKIMARKRVHDDSAAEKDAVPAINLGQRGLHPALEVNDNENGIIDKNSNTIDHDTTDHNLAVAAEQIVKGVAKLGQHVRSQPLEINNMDQGTASSNLVATAEQLVKDAAANVLKQMQIDDESDEDH